MSNGTTGAILLYLHAQEIMRLLFRSKNESSSVHWSKAYVEHLRTVHFALMAVSAVLVVLVTSAKPYDARNALKEIDEIIQVQNAWSPDVIIRNTFREGVETSDSNKLALSACSKTGITLGNSHSEFINVPNLISYPLFGWSPDPFPSTIFQFSLWWDELKKPQNLVIPTEISDTARVRYPTSTVKDARAHPKIIKLACEPIVRSAKEKGLDLAVRGMKFRNPPFELEAGYDPTYTLAILSWANIRVRRETFGVWFPDWRDSSFTCSFADLANASDGLERLTFTDVRQRIYDEIARGSETFEAFGLKFPATQVTVWGITLVVATQLYVFFYLKQLSGKLHPEDAAWDVPWIGMDRSNLARLMLFATLVVAPFFAIVLLSGQAAMKIILGGPAISWTCRSWTSGLPSITILQGLAIGSLFVAVFASGILAIGSWKFRPESIEDEADEDETVLGRTKGFSSNKATKPE
jgi:hypothetical protein